jgi:hypothetical protein
MYNTLRLCPRLHATRYCPRIVSRFYSTPRVPPTPPSIATDEKKTDAQSIKFNIDPSIHDENYIVGSPTNTRNYGKIKVESQLASVLNDVLPKTPKFDNGIQ